MDVLAFQKDHKSPLYQRSLTKWYHQIPSRDNLPDKENFMDETDLQGNTDSDDGLPPDREAFFMVDLRQSSCPVSEMSSQQLAKYPTKGVRTVPQLIFHCLDAQGHSATLKCTGAFPYFYAKTYSSTPNILNIEDKINQFLRGFTNDSKAVIQLELVEKESLMGYKRPDATSTFLKITLAEIFLMPKLREAIRRQEIAGFDGSIYEGNIPFELRVMIDHGLSGCSWFTVPTNGLQKVPLKTSLDEHLRKSERDKLPIGKFRESTSMTDARNLDIHDLQPLEMQSGRWSGIPKELRTLSFDIECTTLGRKGFPVAESDPVIAISLVLKEFGGRTLHKSVLCLSETAALSDGTVVWFDDEAQLLLAFCEYIRLTDPDFLTGYNCFNFDMNYLFDRAEALKIGQEFGIISRVPNHRSKVENARLASKGLGIKDYKNIDIPGRICLDVFEAIRKEYKLKSYSLNAVSAHFLDQQKEDVHYSIIGDLFEGNAETRRRIASYCLKDAVLPLNLLDKLLIVVNMVEMARVTGVPITYLITRGQQIKVTSQILRHCRSTSFLMPTTVRESQGDKYEGATVLEPKKNLYMQPITTLDFASLYPSIMIAHNLCYSTLIQVHNRDQVIPNLTTDEYTKTPVGCEFVKPNVRKGILPSIVDDLISARKRARKMMAEAKDPLTKMVLNGRQLALKISANSVYGYTGAAAAGQLPCLEVSTSITAFGREMIEQTKELVEKTYTIQNGYQANADVIYGDTDSVMVDFGVPTIAEGMRLGADAAEMISKTFISPIKLEFEKVFCPYLLMNKKRYAGLLYSKSPDTWDKMDCKGIETVRRDFCDLVQMSVDTVLKKILIEKDVDGAKEYVRRTIADLMTNKVDMSLLVMTKSIGKEDYTAKLAHVELAKRMKERDPGNAPQVGDRVHYVIVAAGKNTPQYERAEDPLYVLENNLSLDTSYYIDCLKNPICRVLEPCMLNEASPESLFKSGDHTLTKVQSFSQGGALSKFMSAKKILRCLGCRVTLKAGVESQLCEACAESKGASIATQTYEEMGTLQKEFSRLWTQCQDCQGSLVQDVLCTSRDCPIFYRRTKVRKDLAKIEAKLSGLIEHW